MVGRWSILAFPVTLLALGLVLAVSGGTLARAGGHQQVGEDIAAGAAAAGLGLLAWWTAALALAFTAELLRRHGSARAAAVIRVLAPGFMRRLASAVLGVQLVAVPVGAGTAALGVPAAPPAAGPVEPTPASAAFLASPAGPADVSVPVHAGGGPEDGGPVPEGTDRPPVLRGPRVSPGWQPAPVPCGPGLLAREPGRQQDARSAGVVVKRGDSLWSIAAERLGPYASDAEIAASWPRWYEENALLIGPDPGLLLPGQALTPPDAP